MNVKHLTLSNNVDLVIQEVESSLVTSFSFYFAAGSRYEGEHERGISHFTEHMLFKGTKTLSYSDISRIFDRLGGNFNAYTTKETVGAYCRTPSERREDFSLALSTLCDMSANCTFPPAEIEKERDVILKEILASSDDPDESALDEVAKCVWPGHALSLPIAGTANDVTSITAEQLAAWYDERFVHGELTVVVCGKVYEDILISTLEALPEHKVAVPFCKMEHFKEEVPWGAKANVVSSKFNQAQLFVLYPLRPTLTFKEYISLSLFNSIAGASVSSHLFRTLREQNGLCYSVGSFYTLYENAGFWMAYADCDRRDAVRAMKKLTEELHALGDASVITDEEFQTAKDRACASEILHSESTSFLASRLWISYYMGFPFFTTEDVLQTVRSQTKDDIMKLINNLIDDKRRASLVYARALSAKVKKELLS